MRILERIPAVSARDRCRLLAHLRRLERCTKLVSYLRYCGHTGRANGTSVRDPERSCGPGELVDYLIGGDQQRFRDREAERLRGLKIDHQLEFRRKLHREIARLGAAQNAVEEPVAHSRRLLQCYSTRSAP